MSCLINWSIVRIKELPQHGCHASTTKVKFAEPLNWTIRQTGVVGRHAQDIARVSEKAKPFSAD